MNTLSREVAIDPARAALPYSASRDFIRNCRTPMLALPDDVPRHPLQTSIDVAWLAPNALSASDPKRTAPNS
jgi:hypothetical protein